MKLIEIIAKAIGYHFWKCNSDEEAIRMGMPAAKDVIAKAIGYHFWKCNSDEEAIRMGMPAAKDVMKAMEESSGSKKEWQE